MEIPFDVTKVEVPLAVRLSWLAETLIMQCQELRIKVPAQLQPFINTYHLDGAGFNWMERLLKASGEMPIEVLQQWVETIPGFHFFRAEMRAVLMERRKTK